MFRVQIVADSVGGRGAPRLTSFRVEMPKYLQQEVNTHKMINRSAASSRATPVEATLAKLTGAPETDKRPAIKADPFIPLAFGLNEKGMQSSQFADAAKNLKCRGIWEQAMMDAVSNADYLNQQGIHKQFVNRIVEPYCWTRCILTGTEWANFFALRTHPAAEPHFQFLAKAMYVAYNQSVPRVLKDGEPHVPFVSQEETKKYGHGKRQGMNANWLIPCMLSAARCARVSYAMMERKTKPTWQEDMDLYDRLTTEIPKHMGPCEHQAWEPDDGDYPKSNLVGWLQFRKTIPNENIREFSPGKLTTAEWFNQIPSTVFEPWGDEQSKEIPQ